MAILSTVLWTLIAPAMASAASVAAARRLGRGVGTGRRGRWGVAVGLGLGCYIGQAGLLGHPPFPAVAAHEWTAWLALAAAALGVAQATWAAPRWANWLVRALFVASFVGLLLNSKREHAWGPIESAAWLGGISAVVLASWWNLEAQAERIPGPGWMFHLGLVAAGWAAVQALSGGAAPGQLDGVLASAALGALPMVGVRPGLALSRGGPAVASTVLAALGLAGLFYSDVPAPSALLLVLAPWAPWVDRLGVIRRRSPWTRAAVRVLAVLAIVGAAVILAEARSSPPVEGESEF